MNSDDLKKAFIPTPNQFLVCLGVAVLIFGAVYRELWVARLFDNSVVSRSFLEQGWAQQLVRLNSLPFIRTAIIALFWGVVGLIAYLLYLAATNAVTEARNEVVIETQYTNLGKVKDRARPALLQAILAAILIAILILTALIGLPLWFSLFEIFLFNPISLLSLGCLAAAAAGLVVNLYIIWICTQIVFDAD